MAALDTNVLLRFLVVDDLPQSRLAARLFRHAVDTGEPLHVPATVIIELEWVLRSRYAFTKAEIIAAMHRLLMSVELSIESEPAVEAALSAFEESSADFSDCLHVALTSSHRQSPLWTFDRVAARLDGARLLE